MINYIYYIKKLRNFIWIQNIIKCKYEYKFYLKLNIKFIYV